MLINENSLSEENACKILVGPGAKRPLERLKRRYVNNSYWFLEENCARLCGPDCSGRITVCRRLMWKRY
jgi:hypothetical protein